VARANAARLSLASRVRLVEVTVPAGGFELCLANLPYVSDAELPMLEPEAREWEPPDALRGGPDGLRAIRGLLHELSSRPDGPPDAVALEVGAGQAPAVTELVRAAGFGRIGVRHDLAGFERVVLGRR